MLMELVKEIAETVFQVKMPNTHLITTIIRKS